MAPIVALLKLWKVRIGLLVLALYVVGGISFHFRLWPVQGIENCRTHELLDDGSNFFGLANKCGYRCAEGTEVGLQLAQC
jgi:hypothetical protein